jgi:lipopolysaccharide/colanic/teichoic acid biosynthesis glycosyltransferase
VESQGNAGQSTKYEAASYQLVDEGNAYFLVKRLMDIVISSILLILFSPIFFLISLLIYIYSPGPIIFSQERVGAKRVNKDGNIIWVRETFICYKFRTMKVNSDSSIHESYVRALIENDEKKMAALQGGSNKIKKLIQDPRITRPGKILRKLSLDELPQFWNVLRGDMSLVGPRPAIPYEVNMYRPWYQHRLEAKPGITGLQQVTARSTVDFEQQVLLDLEYIQNRSIWMDIKIMIKTPLVVLSTKGAE